MLARIRALTRRAPTGDSPAVVTMGEVTIDLAARSIVRATASGPEFVRLTPTEWQMLEVLVRNAGTLVTRQTLLKEIWGSEHVTDTGYLRLYVAQLRKKLEPVPSEPRYILTDAGMGYRFRADTEG